MKQLKGYDCGPAAILTLFEILSHCTPSRGTSHTDIVNFLRNAGFHVHECNDCSALDVGRPPFLVNYWKIDDGHYGVIDRVTNTRIRLYDPEHGQRHWMKRKNFVKKWYSERYGRMWSLEIIH